MAAIVVVDDDVVVVGFVWIRVSFFLLLFDPCVCASHTCYLCVSVLIVVVVFCDFTQSKIRLCAYRCCCCCCAFILLLFFFSFLFRSCFFCFSSFLFILFVRVPYPIQSKPICIVCCVYTCDVGPRRCISARVLLWRCLCIFYPHIFHFDTHMYIARKRIYNTRPRHTEHYQKAEILSDRQFVVVVCAFFCLIYYTTFISFVRSFFTTRSRRFQ